MTAHRTPTPTGLWARTTQVLGKFWAGMLSLANDHQPKSTRAAWTDFPRFPPY